MVLCVVSGALYAGEVERVEVIVGSLTVLVVGTTDIVEMNFPSCCRVGLAEEVSQNRAVMERGADGVLEIAGPMELNVGSRRTCCFSCCSDSCAGCF